MRLTAVVKATPAQHIARAEWLESLAEKEKTRDGYTARGWADLRLAQAHRDIAARAADASQ